ncbi:MAG: hypothetical protein ABJB65_03900, partial [Chloroflexota bacterium]
CAPDSGSGAPPAYGQMQKRQRTQMDALLGLTVSGAYSQPSDPASGRTVRPRPGLWKQPARD